MGLAKLGVKILKKVSDKLVDKVSDEKIKILLKGFIEIIMMVIDVFTDEDKEDKAQLEALKPRLMNKAYDVIGLILDLD